MKRNCKRCNFEAELLDSKKIRMSPIIHEWLCEECEKEFSFKFEALKIKFLKENPLYKDQFELFPPPWNFYDFPEKTEGWVEFQKEMKKHPEYYLMEFK